MANKPITKIEDNMHPAFEAGRKYMTGEITLEQHEIDDIEDRIRSATMALLMKHEFFGIVALKLKRIMTKEIPTGATDGRSIMYNPAFVKNLSQSELIFLVAHEVYHCVFQHFLRRDSRNPKLWNLSGDYVINFLLDRDRIGKIIEGGCFDKKYEGMTTEQVYEKLFQEFGGGKKNSKGEKGDGMDGIGDTIDTHIEPTNENGDPLSESEAKAMGDELRSVVISAVKAAGNAPSEIKRMVDMLLRPKINWKDLIQTAIQSKVKYDTSFTRPNRRTWAGDSGIILPGDVPEDEINIAVALDNSGSIDNETLRKMLSEVKGIADTFKFRMKVWCFDTRVSGLREFSSDEDNDVSSYEFTGGGGTNIAVNFEYYQKESFDADLLVVFTDMYCGSLKSIDPKIVDTVWVVYDNPAYKEGGEEPPFGRWANYDEK